VHASGVIPQISLIMGPCAGGAVYSPAITDFVVMVDQTSHMFITGPDVIKTVTGEEVEFEELGGARTHNSRSGNAHFMGSDESDALDYVKALLSYLPSNNLSEAPVVEDAELAELEPDDFLDSFIPDSASVPYDMQEVIDRVLDDGEFLEVQPLFAPNIIVGFGRVEGRPVGVVANQPRQFAGILDIDASEKAARFVRTCDAFNIPVVTFVDVPGFLPGTDQEWNGIIRRGAKLSVRRGHRPAGHDHHPEGLRRRLRRDGLQAPRRRPEPGLADRTDRGDGRAGRGQHPLPIGTEGRRRGR
jgi:propionyl-CoA carboxylase beta chain